ncbi:unnamed protein product [Somion occarium]|uniref:Sensitive to high expression protein 9, mitochondrial n=1 Tax=Somion occarium TaxID=3059160 RepID=A0ABP1DZV7_9APHY
MLHTPLRSLRSASVRPRSTYISRHCLSKPPFRSYSTPNPSPNKPAHPDDVSVKPNSPDPPSNSSSGNPSSTVSTDEAIAAASGLSKEESIQLEKLKQVIREWTETTSRTIRKQADAYTARAASTFAQLGSELNKVTGYEEIETLKKRVREQEERIDAARRGAKVAKEEYEKAVLQRTNSQKEVNDLLQRKSSWTDEDVLRFTALVRQDHLFEQSEARAKAATAQTEAEVEREFSELMRVILYRYHEEQVWSDKIRSVSTYGSLTALALNLLVFISAILFVEPWKRKKLAQTFEKKVEEMTTETLTAFEDRTQSLDSRLEKQNEAIGRILETVYYVTQPSAIEEARQGPAEGEELLTPPTETPKGTYYDIWATDPQWLIAATATTAAMLGWLARGWLGP